MNKNIEEILEEKVKEALKSLYGLSVGKVAFEKTKKEFEGDYTLVVFPYVKASQKKPEDTANEIGTYLSNSPEVKNFNVVKGFLNLTISDSYWLNHFLSNTEPGVNKTAKTIMVEYSSPNTNKPLHLGHVRNNLLGYSVAEILKADGNTVIKANLVNDRGIHICKSMLAWQKFGNGETPVSSGMKGDHLVGKYYVEFDKAFKAEKEELKAKGIAEEELDIHDTVILSAIREHTFAGVNMTFAAKIIFLADMAEPYRDSLDKDPDLEHIRELIYKENNLEAALIFGLQVKIQDTLKSGKMIHPLAVTAWNSIVGKYKQ